MGTVPISEEMTVAATLIDSKVIDGMVYINSKSLVEFAATVAATHRVQLDSGDLTENEYSAMLGQQALAMLLIELHEALLLKNATDEVLTESN